MRDSIKFLIDKINNLSSEMESKEISIMEVCGTHTHIIYENGIKEILPENIRLLSGPGCPICVTDISFIDNAMAMARLGATIITFGDIAKVKGSSTSLWEERKNGVDLKLIYSVSSIIEICKENTHKLFVFLGIGFETTAPLIATIIKRAYEEGIKNLYFYTSIKVMPPIIEKLIKTTSINGLILPGNVAVILGESEFRDLFTNTKIPGVIAGFTLEDILISIYYITKQCIDMEKEEKKDINLYNVYKSFVSFQGNEKAKETLKETFQLETGLWRGMGSIPASALVIKDKYRDLNAIVKFGLSENSLDNSNNILGCKCSEVIMGKTTPYGCSLFRKACNSENPIGPCMVSMEGACYCAYKFES